jgi:hypothetical protein
MKKCKHKKADKFLLTRKTIENEEAIWWCMECGGVKIGSQHWWRTCIENRLLEK